MSSTLIIVMMFQSILVNCYSSGAPLQSCDTLSSNSSYYGELERINNVPFEIDTSVFRNPFTDELHYSPNSTYSSKPKSISLWAQQLACRVWGVVFSKFSPLQSLSDQKDVPYPFKGFWSGLHWLKIIQLLWDHLLRQVMEMTINLVHAQYKRYINNIIIIVSIKSSSLEYNSYVMYHKTSGLAIR